MRAALDDRNAGLGNFWFAGRAAAAARIPALSAVRALVIDAEDAFTAMIAHQLRSLGLAVDVRGYRENYWSNPYDLVVMGPGPGDPRDRGLAKITHLRDEIRSLLRCRRPFLAVCLSHQILCDVLGLELTRLDRPNQGTRREIDLFGTAENVGFYNTFAARSPHDELAHSEFGRVRISRDAGTGAVHATRGEGFASVQFHPESVLTSNGPRILGALIEGVLATRVPQPCEP